jgi:hypothetical protein
VALFFAVFLRMRLRRVIGVFAGMEGMGPCGVGVMCRFLVVSEPMVLGRFGVMPGRVRMMFCCMFVMFRGFMRHGGPPTLPGAAS